MAAGADVIQLFDSWVGVLSVSDYEEFVAPYSARVLGAVDVPTIHFGTGTAHLLGAMAAAGGDAIGLDWRLPLDEGWQVVGPEKAVQGNLDPAVLLGPWARIEAAARDVLARAGGRAGHVFNLGHGVLPETDPDDLTRLVELVRELRRVSGSRADGVRVAGPDRGRAGLLRRHPRRPAGAPGAARRPDRALPAARDRGVEPAERDHRADPGGARGRARAAGLHGHEALDAADRRRGRGRARGPVRTIVAGLVLAPHYSRLSIGGYRQQLEEALAGRAELEFVDSWHTEPGFVELLADRVRRTSAHVVFTAHSLPARILAEGDPYERQLLETATAIAQAAGLSDWSFSYQSESPTGEPWLGPDILDHLEALHAKGVDDVLVCPIGFVADHLEIRWDLDTEAQEKADELGMRLARIEMPNADPAFVATLAAIVRRALAVPSIP